MVELRPTKLGRHTSAEPYRSIACGIKGLRVGAFGMQRPG